MKEPIARLIAFYLPQYHPIPENDEWWGKGFTEWTNVAKARPLFRGHHQPNLPADLGFYDLRLHETRAEQAKLARENGVEGFCYWHYWFSGRRILERPFQEVLYSKEPDFPFCLGWANATWSGIWYGCPQNVLIKQEYPGVADYEKHFYTILEAFKDDRYITVDHKPLFVIFQPNKLPVPTEFIDIWQELAIKNGLRGIYFVGKKVGDWLPQKYGFDAYYSDLLSEIIHGIDVSRSLHLKILNRIINYLKKNNINILQKPNVYSYKDFINIFRLNYSIHKNQFPTVLPNWDNTPRSGVNGVVFQGSTPELFGEHLKQTLDAIVERPFDKRIVFLKSWNEWAEGNYVEPDLKYGKKYLDIIKKEIYR